MCGIAGFFSKCGNYLETRQRYQAILKNMNHTQHHRGPDDEGIFLDEYCGLAHVRLSILDLENGGQPMYTSYDGQEYSIVYNGEIYNMKQLRRSLSLEGVEFTTTSDTEVILKGCCRYGTDFIRQLNGIFAFAIWENKAKRLLLCRDRLGVKPLYYTRKEDTLIFSSEVKSLLCYPGIRPEADQDGLCELLALGPAHTYGKCVYKDVFEVLPGHTLTCTPEGMQDSCYWKLESREHTDSEKDTIEKTHFLVHDAIKLQMLSDIPICTFLSGGLDSSVVSAVCAKELQKEGKNLSTYSFDFTENDTYFQSNSFQPSQDAPFALEMAAHLNTSHTRLFCDNKTLADYLSKAVDARDYPCMADVESSLLYFCQEVSKNHKVTLTGECADEIFGGYPWFYRKDMFERDNFPWSYDMDARTALLKDDVIKSLPLASYSQNAYAKTIAETPRLEGENGEEARRRELSYLNLKWFMATLLERMDRTSMYSGLEARVPFADHRIVEYVFNVPWDLKCIGGQEKGLLRHAAEGLLPDSVLYRKKSPYPKTYHPLYEALLKERVRAILSDSSQPIHALIDTEKTEKFLQLPGEYGKPWYGQLMAGPQMLAYVLQMNHWLKRYQVKLLLP